VSCKFYCIVLYFYALLENPKATLHKIIYELKLNITTNTSHTLHYILEYRISTDLQNTDIVVPAFWDVRVGNIALYHSVNSFVKCVVCGANCYFEIVSIHPMFRKIFKYVL